MTTIEFEQNEIGLNEGQSVLEALLDAGHNIPNSCRAGACQSCLMQADDGSIPKQAQQGLKQTQVAAGYFLACCCYPTSPMMIKPVDHTEHSRCATVIDKRWLNPSVLRLRLQCENLNFKAGQYVTLWKDELVGRSYSIASLPDDGFIELHIRVYEQGQLSAWAANTLQVGESLQIQGPSGECFYTSHDKSQALLLAGLGTGLAPLYGIVRDALAQGHEGAIHLFVGGKDPDKLYYQEELSKLSLLYKNFSYTTVVQTMIGNPPVAAQDLIVGDFNQTIKDRYPSTKDLRIFLCGSTDRVKALQRQCFLAGANMKEIFCDLFG